jgi:hypothetical protein
MEESLLNVDKLEPDVPITCAALSTDSVEPPQSIATKTKEIGESLHAPEMEECATEELRVSTWMVLCPKTEDADPLLSELDVLMVNAAPNTDTVVLPLSTATETKETGDWLLALEATTFLPEMPSIPTPPSMKSTTFPAVRTLPLSDCCPLLPSLCKSVAK